MTLSKIPSPVSYRWVIVACCVLAYAVSFMSRWSYTGLAPLIQDDLHLDKAALGVLGSAFFYPYALAQVPWGWLTDRFGGRYVIAGGVLLSALALLLFATATSLWEGVLWRMLLGVVAASAFVPIASLLAQWFVPKERGLVNGLYYGFGGGLGQATAFLLMPLISIYVLQDTSFLGTGWRGTTMVVALLLILVGLFCGWLLRSSPDGGMEEQVLVNKQILSDSASSAKQVKNPIFLSIIKDPVLWLWGGYFACSLVGLRLIPAWLSLYSVDIFVFYHEFDRNAAMVLGGTMATIFAIGHVVGSPLLGKFSDWLLVLRIGRLVLPAICTGVVAMIMGVFIYGDLAIWMLGVLCFILGVALHAFPIVNAAVSERWGAVMTGRALGGVNMVGQIVGAMALSMSGYLGLAFSGSATNPLREYDGIWYTVAGCSVIGVLCGAISQKLVSSRSKTV